MSERQVSPDGRWEWDGQQWVPRQAPTQPVPPPPPGGPPKPLRKGRRWPFILGIPLALIVLITVCSIAVSNSASKPKPTSTPQTNAAGVPTKGPAAAASAAPTANSGTCSPQPCANDSFGFIVKVSNVKYDAQPGNDFEHPEPGNVFVTMDLSFENHTDKGREANLTQFALVDGSGTAHNSAFMGACQYWSSVALAPNGAYGPKCSTFEAVAGKPAPLTLVWVPGGLGGGGYRMKLA